MILPGLCDESLHVVGGDRAYLLELDPLSPRGRVFGSWSDMFRHIPSVFQVMKHTQLGHLILSVPLKIFNFPRVIIINKIWDHYYEFFVPNFGNISINHSFVQRRLYLSQIILLE